MLSEKQQVQRIISIGVYLPIVTAIVGIVLHVTGLTRTFIEYSGIWFGDIQEFELHLLVGSIGIGTCIAFVGGILLAKSRWKPRTSPYFGRIIVALVLIAVVQVVFVWLNVVLPYQRERQFAAKIGVLGGKVQFEYCEPDWIPQFIRGKVPFCDRITSVEIHNTETALSDLIQKMGSLRRLESLDLGWTKITDVGLEDLKGLTSLKKLFLYNTQVTDTGLERLKGLTNLTVLYLSQTQISDSGLENLKGMRNLYQLMLDDTKITSTGLEHLKSLTSLSRIDLGNTHINDAGLEHLKGLTMLNWLDLNNTQITDIGAEHLNGLTSLGVLYLGNTQVTDNGLSHLSALTSLTHFNLAGTPVTDVGLEHLKRLKSLTYLDLDNTQTTEAGREALRRELPKCNPF